jgi:hypothetical protein
MPEELAPAPPGGRVTINVSPQTYRFVRSFKGLLEFGMGTAVSMDDTILAAVGYCNYVASKQTGLTKHKSFDAWLAEAAEKNKGPLTANEIRVVTESVEALGLK